MLFIKIALCVMSTTEFGYSQQSRCTDDFTYMVQSVKLNYSGYRDKTQGREGELTQLTDSLRTAADVVKDFGACTEVLQRWLGFFRDRHVYLHMKRPPDITSTGTSPQQTSKEPSLILFDEATALLRIPSFDLSYEQAMDNLLKENHPKLISTRTLIIDVRGNPGGGDPAFADLIPLLWTNPIQVRGADFWASDDNIEYFKNLLQEKSRPDAVKEEIHGLVAGMQASPGTFVSGSHDREIKYDTVYPFPQVVAILIDQDCASTTEEFLLQARQSRKVTLFGSNTNGALDYANLSRRELPSGQRALFIPTSRSRRLPDDSVDEHGITPDVKVPEGVQNRVAYVRRYLSENAVKGSTRQ